MTWQKRSNPFVIALWRSQLHGLFETHTVLLTLSHQRDRRATA
jgi:hypothetical protein